MSELANQRAAPAPPHRVVVVSGIFPPDIGGPATHAADLATELRVRGHEVTVVTLSDGAPSSGRGSAVRFPRHWPWWLRLAAVAGWLVRHRDRYDVAYATGLQPAAVAGAQLAGRPVVVKVVGDPAWERGRRRGMTTAGFGDFQQRGQRGIRVRLMCRIRDWWVTRADAVVVPGADLVPVVDSWARRTGGLEPHVIPNGVRALEPGLSPPPGPELRCVYVGRLVDHKRVDVLVDAVCATAGVTLDVIGDGPARAALEHRAGGQPGGDRVRFAGALGHQDVLHRLGGFDVLLNASSYEGLPHVAIEALVCGTPIVIPAVGGTSEVLRDGENGLLVDPPTQSAFAATLATLRDHPATLARLTEGARASGPNWRFDRVADRIEALLADVTGPAEKAAAVFVGKGGIPAVSTPAWERKLGVLARHLDATIVSPAAPGPRHMHGVELRRFRQFRPAPVASALFYAGGSALGVARAARRSGAVVCQSPFEAAMCLLLRAPVPARARPRVVLEVHGDWRTAPRLYGSSVRQLAAPVSDRIAGWAVRRADRVRAVGAFTETLARDAGFRGEVDRFMTFSDWGRYLDRAPVPPPLEPKVLFVGALEPYKAPEVLLEAWSCVVGTVPEARLSLVGTGPMLSALTAQAAALGLDGSIEFCGTVPPDAIVDRLDGSRFMVLPSRSEGVPRVVLEAMARARAVVGARAGGTPELLEHGVTGLLVPPDDPPRLADAVVQLLSEAEWAAEMGREARRRALKRDPAGEYDAGVARLAAWIRR